MYWKGLNLRTTHRRLLLTALIVVFVAILSIVTLTKSVGPSLPALRAAPLWSVTLVRKILDAASSNATHVIPTGVKDALLKLKIPELVDVVKASQFLDVELPPRSGRHAKVLGFAGTPGFWQDASDGKWEPMTFKVLSAILASRPGAVIDFGSWIGPTVIAAANLPSSTRVFGMDVDPVAFTQLALNVAANAHVAAKTHVYFVGISDTFSKRSIMTNVCDEGIGDSCTTMIAPKNRDNLFQIIVQTLPLPQFLEAVGVPLEEVVFIKIDAEGAEMLILPPLVDFMSRWPGIKPAVWLSLHEFAVSVPWVHRVSPFMRLYQYGYVEANGVLELLWASLDTSHAIECHLMCTYLLSDTPVNISFSEY